MPELDASIFSLLAPGFVVAKSMAPNPGARQSSPGSKFYVAVIRADQPVF
jgi:hypothetical protein